MLEYLRIRDLALIEDMELEFASGMNVLTGETGAGKSFILKAINFLLGEKLGADMVRPGRDRAQVEALFILPEGERILKRELMAETGRSRFYLNGDLSSQETVREMRASLMLHAGQHGQQRLLQPAYQASLVDSFLPDPSLLTQKDALFKELKDRALQRKKLHARIATLEEKRELLEMQQKEIDKIDPQENEEDRLEAIRQSLRGAERVQDQYEKGFLILRGEDGYGLLEQLNQLESILEALNKDNASFQPELESVLAFRESAHEMERRLRKAPAPEAIDDDCPYTSVDELDARLFKLSQLKRKLKRSLPEILTLKAEIIENLSFLDACGLDMHRLEKEEIRLATALHSHLLLCNAAREQAAQIFCTALEHELAGLGFSDRVRVQPEFTPVELWPALNFGAASGAASGTNSGAASTSSGTSSGALKPVPACIENRARLLWSPNPGQIPQPLDRIASGGELSRFLLGVVSIQAQGEDATLIFDEVDAGVGGITLNRVADRLADLAARRQMLLITHWPQLAARAQRHFMVSKEVLHDETYTRCLQLNPEQRQLELGRMAGIENEEIENEQIEPVQIENMQIENMQIENIQDEQNKKLRAGTPAADQNNSPELGQLELL